MRRWALIILVIALALLIVASGFLAYEIFNSPNGPLGRQNGGSATANLGQTPVGQTQTPVTTRGCGIKKSGSGYTFSWLHVSNGNVLADTNCIVDLKGFNWSQTEFGNGVGGGPKTRINEQHIAWYNQTFHMNVWRIPVNSVWWDQNVNVPLAGMTYQKWIQQVVKWAEMHGDYVILTKGPQFHNPPCGGSESFCPSQNQAKKNIVINPALYQQEVTTGQYIDSGVAMWTSIARLYANDPAVLYDSWNEMHNIDPAMWRQSENTLIGAIRAQNPRSLIFLGGPNYKASINPLLQHDIPDFSQSNLIYDFHIYDGYQGVFDGKMCNEPQSPLWSGWPGAANAQVGFAQTHGKAVAFSEWGGCNDFDQYNQAITSYARTHHIILVYYDETGMVVNDEIGGQLNTNGQKVQAAFATW